MKLTALTVLGVVLILFTLKNSIGGGIAKISPEQAQALIAEKKAVLVDVREKEELETGMLRGALWIPLSGLQSGDPKTQSTLDTIQKDQEIITYCRSGARSGRAGELLVKKGYRVKNLGGFEAAKSAGMVTE